MKLDLSDDANGKSRTFTINCNAIGYTNKLCGDPVTCEYTEEHRCDELFYTEVFFTLVIVIYRKKKPGYEIHRNLFFRNTFFQVL